jgi:hypothetical protein
MNRSQLTQTEEIQRDRVIATSQVIGQRIYRSTTKLMISQELCTGPDCAFGVLTPERRFAINTTVANHNIDVFASKIGLDIPGSSLDVR